MYTSKENLSKHVKNVKKLTIKKGDILVVTLKGFPTDQQAEMIRSEFGAMPFMKGVHIIVKTDLITMKISKPHDGKNPVLLDNLEYLEYLAKKKGD